MAYCQPDALITEATNIDDAKLSTEAEVVEKIDRIVSATTGLILAGFNLNDIDRLRTFYNVAKNNNRQLAISMKQAWLVHNLRDDKHLNLFCLDDPNILMFQREKETSYAWEEVLKKQYPNRVTKSSYINLHQGEVILVASLYDMNEMVIIQPKPGSVYILSQSEPFNEEAEINYDKLLNWLEFCGIPFYQVHASGHLSPHELKEFVSQIKPKKLFIVHSEKPKLAAAYLKDLDIEVVPVEEGKPYPV